MVIEDHINIDPFEPLAVVRLNDLMSKNNNSIRQPYDFELQIGQIPMLAAGNADGDLHMLWSARLNPIK